MLLLAQSTPSHAAVGAAIEMIAYLAVTVAAVIVAWKQITGKSEEVRVSPTPLEVKAHEAPVTREQLEKVDTALHGRMKRERSEIEARIDRVEQAAKERSDKLDEKLDRNTELTAATRGEVKLINQNVSQLSTSLTTFLQNAARQ